MNLGLCKDEQEALALIYAGLVIAEGQRVEKPGQELNKDSQIRIKTRSFVSRGGEKLYGAILAFGLKSSFEGTSILDVGASTGGFTDCVLKLGAEKVLALDVGFNQLHWKLKTNSSVTSLEKTDIRDFDSKDYAPFDWILTDISFNSLENLAPCILKHASDKTQCLFLIKPQFEVSPHEVPKGGVIKNEELWKASIEKVQKSLEKLGAKDIEVEASPIKGKTGNQEFFILFKISTHSKS